MTKIVFALCERKWYTQYCPWNVPLKFWKYCERVFTLVPSTIVLKNFINTLTYVAFDFRHENVVSWFAWQGIFHHVVYQIIGILGVIFLACIPINALVNDNERILPLDGWYPYDTTKTYAFFITWAHQVILKLLKIV